MLTCQQLTEVVTDYVEGRMTFWQRAQVQLHLGMCTHCRTYLRQMRTTQKHLGSLGVEPVKMAPDVQAELLKRFAALRRPPR